MFTWGLIFIVLGVGSFLLPLAGRQFAVVSLIGLAGGDSMVVGLLLAGAGFWMVKSATNKSSPQQLRKPLTTDATRKAIELGNAPNSLRLRESPPQNAASTPTAANETSRVPPNVRVQPGSTGALIHINSEQRSISLARSEELTMQESDVSVSSVAKIFADAFMEVSDVENDGFRVKGIDLPFPFGVTIDTARKLVRFRDINRLYRMSEQEAALICNRVNNGIMLTRFYAAKVGEMVVYACELDTTYERGLEPFQLVSNFRAFDKISGQVIRAYFSDHLRE